MYYILQLEDIVGVEVVLRNFSRKLSSCVRPWSPELSRFECFVKDMVHKVFIQAMYKYGGVGSWFQSWVLGLLGVACF